MTPDEVDEVDEVDHRRSHPEWFADEVDEAAAPYADTEGDDGGEVPDAVTD